MKGIDTLIEAYFDRSASEEQLSTLGRWLKSDPANARRFLLLSAFHTGLRHELGPRDKAVLDASAPQATPPATEATRRIRRYALAAVLAIAAVVAAIVLRSPNPQFPVSGPSPAPQAVAMLSNLSDDAVFADSPSGDIPMQLGANLPIGPIHLTAGRAQFMFVSTAVVDLTGPCEFEMTGPNRGKLTSGTLEAFVPERAHGFTVDLPGETRVVDLGTRFRVNVDGVPNAIVEVIDGRVRIESSDRESVTLAAGDRWVVIDGRPASFVEVPLVNAGFEDAPLANAADYQPVVPGWVGVGRPGTMGKRRSYVADTPDGTAWAHLQGYGSLLGQKLGAGLELLNQTIDVEYLASRRLNESRDLRHRVMIIAGSQTTFEDGVVLDQAEADQALLPVRRNDQVCFYRQIHRQLQASGNVQRRPQLWLVFENRLNEEQSADSRLPRQLLLDRVRVHTFGPHESPASPIDRDDSRGTHPTSDKET